MALKIKEYRREVKEDDSTKYTSHFVDVVATWFDALGNLTNNGYGMEQFWEVVT